MYILLSAIQKSAMLLDTHGNIIALNERLAERRGKKVEGMVGTDVFSYLNKKIADSRRKRFWEQFKERYPKFKSCGVTEGLEFEMIRKDGFCILASVDGKIV